MRILIILFRLIYTILTPSQEKRFRRKLLRMKWSRFEIYVTDMFTRYGYDKAYRTGRDGPDGGKDVVIEHEDKRYLVQCKHWTHEQVGVALVREFYAVIVENGAAGGYFITLSGYTIPAMKYARNKPIRLISLDDLVIWEGLVCNNASILPEIQINDPQAPRCKSGVMKVKRAGKTGTFWGCGEWPECYCRKKLKVNV